MIDADRLHTHSEDTSEGKLFLIFLSLIYISRIRRVMNEKNDMKGFRNYSFKEIIQELEKIKFYIYENDEKTMLNFSPMQKKILEAFEISEENIRKIIEPKAVPPVTAEGAKT